MIILFITRKSQLVPLGMYYLDLTSEIFLQFTYQLLLSLDLIMQSLLLLPVDALGSREAENVVSVRLKL